MSGSLGLFTRLLFVVAVVMTGFAVWERALNFVGFTMFHGYPPSRLLELAGVVVLFVIALELRAIKHLQMSSGGKG
jgi:hypothetical protein